jgi:hypothetical protein
MEALGLTLEAELKSRLFFSGLICELEVPGLKFEVFVLRFEL